MSSKSASRKLSGPGADSFIPSMNGGSSDSLPRRSPRPAMSFGVTTLLMLLVFSSVIAPCRAQSSKIFQWGFAGNALSQSLPACRSLGITVKPFTAGNDTHGTPPFYMIALAVGGTPTTSLIGTNENNLTWVVDQPIGTQMMLQVVDANGSSGGVPPGLFTVVPGTSTTSCIPAPSTEPAFTLTANVSDTLNTCQPWGLSIVGGVPPYNLTLAALNSPITTNVTLLPTDDHFTYINRADPNGQLVAAISDFNGRWATGTPIVSTAGSTDVSCTGIVGGGSTNAKVAAQEKAAAAAAVSRKKMAVVTGVVVTLIVVLLLAGVGVWLFLRRRKVQQRTQEITPRQFEGGSAPPQTFQETGGQILSINSFITPGSPPRSPQPSLSHSVSRSSPRSIAPSEENPFEPPPPLRRSPESSAHSASTTHSHGLQVRNPNRPAAFTSFPTASVRRSAKEIEASLERTNSMNSEYYVVDGGGSDLGRSQSSIVAGPSGTRQVPSRSASTGTTGTSVFQHEDAGVVQELPPPYADRGRP